MTANNKKKVQVQIDLKLSSEAEAIFKQLDLTPTTAITAFYNYVAATGELPFDKNFKKLTARELATMRFLRADKDTPVHEITTKKELDNWFNEDWWHCDGVAISVVVV